MSPDSLPSEETLSEDALRLIRSMAQEFEKKCRAAPPWPSIEEALANQQGTLRQELLGALLAVELSCRTAAGETIAKEAYALRFPQDGRLLSRVFRQHLQTPGKGSPAPAPATRQPGDTSAGSSSNLNVASQVKAMLPRSSSGGALRDLPEGLRHHPQYEIVRELGRGGMGVVYLARNRQMDRLEVLKVMGPELLGQPEARVRFEREIRAAAQLRHINVVTAYSVLSLDHSLILAMEYIEGEDLAQVLKAQGPLPVVHACYYAFQVAQGLQHAFEKHMVHRDIKPQNLLRTREGKKHVIKILDFGLAKVVGDGPSDFGLTGTGQALGTPAYMAPEQLRDAARADIRADIYSLGCTLYHFLVGEPPFQATNLYDLMQAHLEQPARSIPELRSEVSPELDAIVQQMLAKEPADRYQTPAEVAQALVPYFKTGARDSAAGSSGNRPAGKAASSAERRTATAPPGPAERADREESARSAPPKPSRKAWFFAAIAGAAAVILVAAGLWGSGLIKVKTQDGILTVQVNEPHAEVTVDGATVAVSWDASGNRAEIRVKPGTHQVKVTKDGFTAVGEEVTLTSGGRELLQARLEPLPPTAPPPEPAKADSLSPPLVQRPDEQASSPIPERTRRNPASGRAQAEETQAVLHLIELINKLSFGRHPARDRQRRDAIQELSKTIVALESNPPDPKAIEHLKQAKDHLAGLESVASNLINKTVVDSANKELDALIAQVTATLASSATIAGDPRQRVASVHGPSIWERQGNELVCRNTEAGDAGPDSTQTLLWFGDPSWKDIEFTFQAQRVTGPGTAFGLIRVRDADNRCTLILGLRGRNLALTQRVEGQYRWLAGQMWSPEDNHWYDVRLRARGNQLEGQIGDGSKVTATSTALPAGAVGIAMGKGVCRFRKFRVTDSSGKVLWTGLPTLPR